MRKGLGGKEGWGCKKGGDLALECPFSWEAPRGRDEARAAPAPRWLRLYCFLAFQLGLGLGLGLGTALAAAVLLFGLVVQAVQVNIYILKIWVAWATRLADSEAPPCPHALPDPAVKHRPMARLTRQWRDRGAQSKRNQTRQTGRREQKN